MNAILYGIKYDEIPITFEVLIKSSSNELDSIDGPFFATPLETIEITCNHNSFYELPNVIKLEESNPYEISAVFDQAKAFSALDDNRLIFNPYCHKNKTYSI